MLHSSYPIPGSVSDVSPPAKLCTVDSATILVSRVLETWVKLHDNPSWNCVYSSNLEIISHVEN